MCGIICEICYSGYTITKDDKILQRIKNRGPDCIHEIEIDLKDGIRGFFYGAVLWMQGPEPTIQPIENDNGLLLYNGDIFDETWDNNYSDTELIMKHLSNASSEDHFIKTLKSLKGPFSIIYYNKLTQDLYFTRDRIGRSTLLFFKNKSSIIISSVLDRKYKSVEIPATHIYKLNINSNEIKIHSWINVTTDKCDIEEWLNKLQKQQSLPDEEFSFEPDVSLDLNEENDVVRYIEFTAQETNCKIKVLNKLMENDIIKNTMEKITYLLEKSTKIRLEKQPHKCKKCLLNKTLNCKHCTVGILFSGGLDCTILAFLADKYLPKEQRIDLINVAFKKDSDTSYDVPDRLTGRQSFEELKKLCQSRQWIFKEVNVPKKQLEEYQLNIIGDLVYPRQTILDESLGSALWFAARSADDEGYSCRILLLGSGADELFGGYTRHRNAFKRHGWSGLNKELELDWRRISFRNLARDNRVICDHGRQPRMPYLDEDFTEFVLKLKPWLKCFPSESLSVGIGDKLMLRLVALHLGLQNVVTFPKRALQFGSRIANKKEKGSDISKTFINM